MRAAARAWAPVSRAASCTLASPVSSGSRWKNWKTKPTRRRRRALSSRSLAPAGRRAGMRAAHPAGEQHVRLARELGEQVEELEHEADVPAAERRETPLADEPTGNLDEAAGAEVLRLLRESAGEGRSVVMVTHEPAATASADRVLRLEDGRLVDA